MKVHSIITATKSTSQPRRITSDHNIQLLHHRFRDRQHNVHTYLDIFSLQDLTPDMRMLFFIETVQRLNNLKSKKYIQNRCMFLIKCFIEVF